MYRKVAVLVSFFLLFLGAFPSLSVTTTNLNSITPQQLAQMLAGPGVTVSNVTFTGANVAGGSFTGGLADGPAPLLGRFPPLPPPCNDRNRGEENRIADNDGQRVPANSQTAESVPSNPVTQNAGHLLRQLKSLSLSGGA